MREADPRALDLPRPGLAAQLVHELDDLAERGRPERFALREQAAARIHRPGAAQRGRARREQRGLLTRGTQIELLVREELARRVGVLALDDVEVVGTDARFGVRVARRESGRRNDVVVVDPRLPGIDASSAFIARIRQVAPTARVLVLNWSDTADQTSGADAYVRKTFRPHELIDAVVSTSGRSVA